MQNQILNKKILLIDDDADDRKYFQEALAEIDATIEFVQAKDGQQALEILRDLNISLPNYIFLDLRMPRISGKQCLAQMQLDERLKSIPIIIYTTSNVIEESVDFASLGAVHFISKPSDPDEINNVIYFALQERWKDN